MREYCIVTGCAGMIGVNLCQKLVENYNVIGIDNLSLGTLENIKDLRKHENFTFKYGNVSALSTYSLIIPDHVKIKTVFHLAANSDISKSSFSRELRDTLMTTIEVLRFCKTHDIKEVIFASSGSVYGEAYLNSVCCDENYGPLIPISWYGSAKLSSEVFIETWARELDCKSWICRLPNVVGTPATHGVILDFVNKLKKNPHELKVLGDGNQTKPYMHVTEVIDAMLFMWHNANETINTYNIAPVGRTKVSDIAEWLVSKYAKGFAINRLPDIKYTGGDRGWPGDVPQTLMDGTKLRKLGYINNLTSDEAVKRAIQEITEKYD